MNINPDKSLMRTHPEISKTWDYAKNTNLTPWDVTYGIHDKELVWWKCSEGHEWQDTVRNRVHKRTCPYCVIQEKDKENLTLDALCKKTTFHTENKMVLVSGEPESIQLSSQIKKEPPLLIYPQQKSRHLSCTGYNVIKGLNDLATTHPKLVSEWNFDKNISIAPQKVMKGSKKKVWWICSKGHEWEATICSRIEGSGCPYCSGRFAIKGETDLGTSHPELVKEWDYEKNNPLTPQDIKSGSGKRVWWKCKNGHSWEESPYNRRKGCSCPICSGHRVVAGFNDLATTMPQVANEWNYEKNYPLTPKDVSQGSGIKVWWKCVQGHEWQASIYSRQKSSCPICSGHKVLKGYNDLATTNPELLSEWNYEKNGPLTPHDITRGTSRKVWWKCSNGHSWSAAPAIRSKGIGCPMCSNKMVQIGYNDFATTNPELSSEWNYEKNAPLTPQDITRGSGKKIWWKCTKGHEWQSAIYNRIKGNGCPYCSKERHTSFPEQALFYYIKKYFPDTVNSDKSAIGMELDIFIPSEKIAIEYDGAAWHKKTRTRNVERKKNTACLKAGILLIRVREDGLEDQDGCICITSKNPKLDSDLSKTITEVLKCISISIKFDIDIARDRAYIYNQYLVKEKEQSLQSLYPKLALEWDYSLNGDLTPSKIYSSSGKKVWWKCSIGHNWQAAPNNRIKGVGCPVCAGYVLLKGYNDLASANPELSAEWNYEKNYPLTPSEIYKSSTKKVWWKCPEGHEWESTVSNRTQGHGCPYCSGHRVTVGYNDLATTNPELLTEWDYDKNKSLTPQNITKGSGKKVWWKCLKGHEWQATIYNRVKGSGCPYCAAYGQFVHKATLGETDLATTNPELISEWDYVKNSPLTPQEVTKGSGKKVWWICTSCKREWQTRISHRANGIGCPYCKRIQAGKMRRKQIRCIETGIIYNGIEEAGKEYNIHGSNIGACANGKKKTAGGYHWEYVE